MKPSTYGVHYALPHGGTVQKDFFLCMRWVCNSVLMFHFSRVNRRLLNELVYEFLTSCLLAATS